MMWAFIFGLLFVLLNVFRMYLEGKFKKPSVDPDQELLYDIVEEKLNEHY